MNSLHLVAGSGEHSPPLADVADEQLTQVDWGYADSDLTRYLGMNSLDPVTDYYGFPDVQRRIIACEHAVARIAIEQPNKPFESNTG